MVLREVDLVLLFDVFTGGFGVIELVEGQGIHLDFGSVPPVVPVDFRGDGNKLEEKEQQSGDAEKEIKATNVALEIDLAAGFGPDARMRWRLYRTNILIRNTLLDGCGQVGVWSVLGRSCARNEGRQQQLFLLLELLSCK